MLRSAVSCLRSVALSLPAPAAFRPRRRAPPASSRSSASTSGFICVSATMSSFVPRFTRSSSPMPRPLIVKSSNGPLVTYVWPLSIRIEPRVEIERAVELDEVAHDAGEIAVRPVGARGGIDAVAEIQQPVPAFVIKPAALQHFDEVHEAGGASIARPRFIFRRAMPEFTAGARDSFQPMCAKPEMPPWRLRRPRTPCDRGSTPRRQVRSGSDVVMDGVAEVPGARVFLARRR